MCLYEEEEEMELGEKERETEREKRQSEGMREGIPERKEKMYDCVWSHHPHNTNIHVNE